MVVTGTERKCTKCGQEWVFVEGRKRGWERVERARRKLDRGTRELATAEFQQEISDWGRVFGWSGKCGIEEIDRRREIEGRGRVREKVDTQHTIICMCWDGKFRRIRYEFIGAEIRLLWTELLERKIEEGEKYGEIVLEMTFGVRYGQKVLLIKEWRRWGCGKRGMEFFPVKEEEK